MKYTEGLFKFPIKVVDMFSAMRAIVKESKGLEEATREDIDDVKPEEADWVRGYARIPVEEIKGWSDSFEEGEDVSLIAEEGFKQTMIVTKTMGIYECLWPMKRFEEELDKFVDSYAKGIDDMATELLRNKAAQIAAIQSNKPKKWRLWTNK